MEFTPKNIFIGRTSTGTSFTIREWDFKTLATLESLGFIIQFLLLIALGSVIAPILTLLTIVGFRVGFRFSYIVSLLFGGYMLFDVYNGWVMLSTLGFFFEERTIYGLVLANGVAIFLTLIMLIFGGIIGRFILHPLSGHDEDSYELLSIGEKKRLDREVGRRKVFFFFIMFFMFFIGLVIVRNTIHFDKGWVKAKTHIENVGERPIEETLTPEQNRLREKRFDELERKYGN